MPLSEDPTYSHRDALDEYIPQWNVHPSKLTISLAEAMRRAEAHEEERRQKQLKDSKKRNRPITFTPIYTYGDKDGKEYMSIRIDTHEDDTHFIRFSPGMSDHDWKIEFDPETHEYRCTVGTWLETIKRNGFAPLWKRGEYLE